jgi:hypothetical protein
LDERLARLRVDISQQSQMSDLTIDKIVASAIGLIGSQEPHMQEPVANVWLAGISIAADAIQACLIALDKFEAASDDMVFLEYTWQGAQTAVAEAASNIKGVMHPDEPGQHSRWSSEQSLYRRGHSSVNSGVSRGSIGSWVKRLSTAWAVSEDTNSRRFSVDDIRESISAACPVVLPENRGVANQFQVLTAPQSCLREPIWNDMEGSASITNKFTVTCNENTNGEDLSCHHINLFDAEEDTRRRLEREDSETSLDMSLSPMGIRPLRVV